MSHTESLKSGTAWALYIVTLTLLNPAALAVALVAQFVVISCMEWARMRNQRDHVLVCFVHFFHRPPVLFIYATDAIVAFLSFLGLPNTQPAASNSVAFVAITIAAHCISAGWLCLRARSSMSIGSDTSSGSEEYVSTVEIMNCPPVYVSIPTSATDTAEPTICAVPSALPVTVEMMPQIETITATTQTQILTTTTKTTTMATSQEALPGQLQPTATDKNPQRREPVPQHDTQSLRHTTSQKQLTHQQQKQQQQQQQQQQRRKRQSHV